jgi:hypothetical protein
VVESLVFSLTSAGFSYTYNLVVDIRKPAAASKNQKSRTKQARPTSVNPPPSGESATEFNHERCKQPDRKTPVRRRPFAPVRQRHTTTPIGSRVLVRDYGSDLFSLVDNPRDDMTRLQIIAASATALAVGNAAEGNPCACFFPEGKSGCVLDIEGINKETNLPVRTGDITIYGKQL